MDRLFPKPASVLNCLTASIKGRLSISPIVPPISAIIKHGYPFPIIAHNHSKSKLKEASLIHQMTDRRALDQYRRALPAYSILTLKLQPSPRKRAVFERFQRSIPRFGQQSVNFYAAERCRKIELLQLFAALIFLIFLP